MSVTVDDVKWVAQLARLRFSPKEEALLAIDLNRILEYMAKLNELDTERVEPTSHAVPLTNAFRSESSRAFCRDRSPIRSGAPAGRRLF